MNKIRRDATAFLFKVLDPHAGPSLGPGKANFSCLETKQLRWRVIKMGKQWDSLWNESITRF